ncbi:MAG: biotin--[acetyl-CoA-carboxylase] ligase [Planctomycetaceae bacterium]
MADLKHCRQRLLDETFLTSVAYHAELASTNERALRTSAEDAAALPALVIAERQTRGRGRAGNRWWSADGALTFSLIVSEEVAGFAFDGGPIALLAGLAVAEALQEILPPGSIGLKWPNDVQAGGRKICGILSEIPPTRRDRVVIGIGINVNNSRRDAPVELRETVSSVCDEIGEDVSRVELLVSTLRAMERRLKRHSRDPRALPRDWRPLCVLTGRTMTATQSGADVTGICRGIADDGTLRLQTPSGMTAVRSATSVRRRDRPIDRCKSRVDG